MGLADFGWHAGRVILASLFILAGASKLANPELPVAMMAAAGFPVPHLLVWPLVILELGGGLWVAIGRWQAWWPALVLAAFTIATNVFFHRFWALEGDLARLELSLFFKNVAVAGGLLAVAGVLHRQAGVTAVPE